MEGMHRVGEFAALTGVSIRTLHHYDQIGLLRPTGRSEASYRLYSSRDLLCLQQILTLRYLGFPLQQIRELLRRPDFDLVVSMRIQQTALRDRISELQRIDAALGELVERRLATGRWKWDLVSRASAAVQSSMEHRGDMMSDYYSPEQMKDVFATLGKQVPAEVVKQTEEQWAVLVREVRANRDLDPTDPKARALADRWNALTKDMFQWYPNDPKLFNSIRRNYEQNAYASNPDAPTMEDFAFIERVNQARTDGGADSGSGQAGA
jgi:MerR family transcriptional regulator, thiopeptide resistance regulator